MVKKILLTIGSLIVVATGVVAVSAYEAWVVNVTAHIENSLYVHPENLEYNTVFPQEYFENQTFFVTFSSSFSASGQTRVKTVEYKVVQKPKPRNTADTEYCHTEFPANPNDPNDPYYAKCYPSFCQYLSKHPDNFPASSKNDEGVNVPHPLTPRCSDGIDNEGDGYTDYPSDTQCVSAIDNSESQAGEQAYNFGNSYGRIHKSSDIGDIWLLDFPVPCFYGECDQEYLEGIKNGTKAEPLPAGLNGQTFGCDLWVEVTNIY